MLLAIHAEFLKGSGVIEILNTTSISVKNAGNAVESVSVLTRTRYVLKVRF